MFRLVVALVALIFASAPTFARTWQIAPDGSGDAPTIQAGIDSAAAGDTVLVACGTYYEHDIVMKAAVCLRSETGEPDCATIDAQSLGRVIYCDSIGASSRIEGLTLTGAYVLAPAYGGGMYCRTSSPTVTRCRFLLNSTTASGGGLHCRIGASPLVEQCDFEENTAGRDGGGADSWNDSGPTFRYCTFRANVAADEGGGASCGSAEAHASFDHCTFYGNHAAIASGIHSRYSDHVTVESCIIAFGFDGAGLVCAAEATFDVSCTDLFGNEGGDWIGCVEDLEDENGNLSGHPQLCDPEDGDLHIADTSPCAATSCGVIGARGIGCTGPIRSVWFVRPDGSGDAPTIQAAIDSAAQGDTIYLADGTYRGEGNRDIDYLGKAVVVISEGGDPSDCTIDCEATDIDPHRGFLFASGEGSSSVLEGVRILHGVAPSAPSGRGGGVYLQGSSPRIRNCVFEADNVVSGSAVYASGSTALIEDCEFLESLASSARTMYLVQNTAESFVVRRCRFFGNASVDNAAVYIGDSYASFEQCVFEGNRGGAVYSEIYWASPRFFDCSFLDNSTSGWGGAAMIYFFPSFPDPCEFRRCLFAGNRAGLGGALCGFLEFYDDINPGYPPLVVDSCTFVGNVSPNGAAVYSYATYARLQLSHSILAFNDSSSAVDVNGECPLVSCTDIYGNAWGDWADCLAPLLGTNGNISAEPLFCDAAAGDYSLDASSPCLADPACGPIGAYGQGCDVYTSVAGGGSMPLRVPVLLISPNPSPGEVVLRYSRTSSSPGRLRVYDIRGRVVRDLEATSPTGVVTWDGRTGAGREVSPGVYFVRMEDGKRDVTGRVVVVK